MKKLLFVLVAGVFLLAGVSASTPLHPDAVSALLPRRISGQFLA
jgi:hypothetical protein